jgi:hypothetical protein
MQEILLSKKFIFALTITVMGFVLLILDKTTSESFFKFVEIVGAGYVIGNGVDKINDTITEIK